MKLKKIGFFRELEHGDDNGKSLKENICNSASKDEDKIVKYLNSGAIFCVSPGVVMDIFDESKGIIRSLEILTDGEWAWPSDLSYYVTFYHLKLDEVFIEHIKKNKWIVPYIKDTDLLKFEL